MAIHFDRDVRLKSDTFAKSDRVPQRAAAGIMKAQSDLREFVMVRAKEIGQDAKLSAAGHKIERRKMIGELLQDTARNKAKLQRMRTEINGKKPKLSIEHARDAYSAAIDVALAGKLAAMDDTQRERALSNDPAFAAAALRLPPALTGVTESLLNHIRERALEAEHPGEMEKIRTDLEAIDLAESITDATLETMRSQGDFGDGYDWAKFSAASLKPIEDELKVARELPVAEVKAA